MIKRPRGPKGSALPDRGPLRPDPIRIALPDPPVQLGKQRVIVAGAVLRHALPVETFGTCLGVARLCGFSEPALRCLPVLLVGGVIAERQMEPSEELIRGKKTLLATHLVAFGRE